jgi:hypothetical protein
MKKDFIVSKIEAPQDGSPYMRSFHLLILIQRVEIALNKDHLALQKI